jgi:nucleotide-binding universal stress UspA family protein
MKTVFIATDFSEAAHNASKYGVELASSIGANIVLFHAYTIPLSIPESYVIVRPEEVKKSAEDYLLEEVLKLRKSTMQSIDILAVEGDPVDMIINQIKNYEEPLVVVGMKGEGKNFRKLFGSVASGLARKSFLPLFIIPETVIFKGYKNIALAIDDEITIELNGLSLIHKIGEIHSSKIYIVRALNNSENIVSELSLRSNAISGRLSPLQVEFAFPRGNDISHTILNFCKEREIDLLILIPHYHSVFERLFVRSETRKMIFETEFPLFLLPDVKVQKKKSKEISLHHKMNL